MRNISVLCILVLLLSQCAQMRIGETDELNIEMKVKEAFLQREVPGVENIKPQWIAYLLIEHGKHIQVREVFILNETLGLKGQNKVYRANFENDDLKTYKGKTVEGILYFTICQEERQMPIVFNVKEDLYLP